MGSYLDIERLASLVRSKRGSRGLRETAQEIGNVSPSTISRVENGKIPDMDTFLAICDWLEIHPIEFIKNTVQVNLPKKDDYSVLCAKLRTDKTIRSDLSDAIARLIEVVCEI